MVQQTEAFAAIDVNSGRYEGKKTAEENAFYINCQAVPEAVRQIHLRRLSGIVLIDLINMKEAEHRKEIMTLLKNCSEAVGRNIRVVDLTSLQIAELTVKKEGRSLAEQLAVCGYRYAAI